MRRRMRQAAGVLAAVALTGLARPAPALFNPFASTATKPAPTRSGDAPASAARLDEMETEIAWMAEEATFACPLSVTTQGGYLLLSGTVPSPAVKTRALQVASQVAHLPLKETIRVQPVQDQGPKTPPAPGLQAAASQRLLKNFGKQSSSFEILTLDHGRLVVRGKVASYEDKLAVSRSLRQLSGVSSVQNQLEVTACLQQGHAVSRVTRDGKLLVAVEVPVPAPQHTVVQVPAPQHTMVQAPVPAPQHTVVPATPPDPKTTAATATKPTQAAQAGRLDPHTQAHNGVLVADTQGLPKLPAPAPLADGVVKGATSTGSDFAGNRQAQTSTTVVPVGYQNNGSTGVVVAASPVPADPATSRLQPVPTTQYIVDPNQRPASTGKPKGGLLARLFGWNKEKETEVYYPSSKVVVQGVVSSNAVPPAHFTQVGGTVTVPQVEIATAADKSGTPKTTGKPMLPYVSNGVMIIDEDDHTATAQTTRTATAAVQADFQQRVAALCGAQARNVVVVTGPDRVVHLKMFVDNAAVEKVVRDKILRLPEMHSPGMQLEITLEH